MMRRTCVALTAALLLLACAPARVDAQLSTILQSALNTSIDQANAIRNATAKLPPVERAVVQSLEAAATVLSDLAAAPPVPTTLAMAYMLAVQYFPGLKVFQPVIDALSKVPPPLFSTVDPTAVVFVNKTNSSSVTILNHTVAHG